MKVDTKLLRPTSILLLGIYVECVSASVKYRSEGVGEGRGAMESKRGDGGRDGERERAGNSSCCHMLISVHFFFTNVIFVAKLWE